ncbi:MAG: glutaredoxin [Tissierellia bacterium]|nr:glutaredoxin [Tissierellia bacterium]
MPKLELYYKPTCPYCMKVMRFMDKNDIEIPMINIDEDKAGKENLEKVGGSAQVPCLFLDDKPMYESSDIIAYFKENVVK